MKRFGVMSAISLGIVAGSLAVGQLVADADGIPTVEPMFYAGTLLESGIPVDGERSIDINLWDNAEAKGTPQCAIHQDNTEVTDGRFRIPLDASCVAGVRAHSEAWIEVRIDGKSLGTSKLGATPYAVAAQRAETAPGTVGIGSIIAHMPNLSGSASIAEMQANGFALCNGQTPEQQGILGAVLAAPTPDLNGERRFLRGGPVADAGQLQADATAKNGLTVSLSDSGHGHSQPAHQHSSRVADSPGFCNNNNGNVPKLGHVADWNHASASSQGCGYFTSSTAPSVNSAQSNVAAALSAGDAETRPTNASVVWLMRVR